MQFSAKWECCRTEYDEDKKYINTERWQRIWQKNEEKIR